MEDDEKPGSESPSQQDQSSQQTGDRPQIPRTSRPELGNLQTEAMKPVSEVKKEEK